MKKILFLVSFALSAAWAYSAEPLPYTEGPVTEVSYIKVKPGMFDTYMKWLGTERKQLLEAEKQAGLIVGYKVFAAYPRNPHEPDLILTITFPNMAALDNLDAKEAPIAEKVMGSRDKATAAAIDREKMREVLGGELIRELITN